MRIATRNTHRGVQFKNKLQEMLVNLGHEVLNVGTDTADSVDYPDIATEVAQGVASGQVDRGILVCGTGIGMAITANKVPGVRATTCHDEVTAEVCRRHNDVNVLCLSGDLSGERRVERMVAVFLETAFDGGRHQRRIDKISSLETSGCNTIDTASNDVN